MLQMLAWMLVGHALADYPLQGDWLSKAKNPNLELVASETIWPLALLSHSAIHAGAVQLATGSWILAIAEFVAHTVIDFCKCKGRIGYNADQLLHIGCKVIWIGAFANGLL